MPFLPGKYAAVWFDNLDASVYFNDMGLDLSVDTADTSTFQNTYKNYIEGDAASKVTLKGFYDKTEDAALMGNIQDGGSVLTAIAGSAIPPAIGDVARLVLVHAADISESSPVGGAVLVSAGYQGDAIVGFGTVLHSPVVADVGTTTGAGADGGAATTTGWHAHLHVTAVTGAPTSWAIKLVDASASNFSDVADITGAAFTLNNAPTGFSQRLSSATTTATVRRYVRYVATVVGGTAPTITFGLAFSRN